MTASLLTAYEYAWNAERSLRPATAGVFSLLRDAKRPLKSRPTEAMRAEIERCERACRETAAILAGMRDRLEAPTEAERRR